VFWNREFRDQFDLPPDMLRVGVGLDEIIRFNADRGLYGPGPTDEHIEARLETLLAETEPLRLRMRALGRVLEVRSARLPDGGVVVTYTDATAQVQSEEELEAQNETLEVRVRERTDELVRLNAELARAKADAEEANLSKTRFLAAASHDILQPLHAARLYASSLGERIGASDDADNLPLARNVDASLEAVEDILTTLLDISRLDAGAMKPEVTRFRIDDILQRLKVEFGPMAAEAGVRLTFVASSLTTASDRRLLRRLLQNLVSNAIKYTPQGRVLVGVRRRGAALRVEVWDTGLGIPEADQKTIFREFTRLAPAVRSARGVGLGLSIVERISRVLGCEVTVRSTFGKGSMFSVDLPRAKRVAASAHQGSVAAGDPHALAGMVVAAIDNEPRIVQGLTSLLAGWGCRCIGGADAKAVLLALTRDGLAPDAVIADFHLDETDGLAAVATLRARFGAQLPAVIVTADRGDAIREQANTYGVRILHKPLRPAALRALLSQWRVAPPAPYPDQAAGE
jgi:signal transduction histidine kinase